MEKQKLVCPLCKGTQFKQELGKVDSEWGASAHKMTIFICENCSHVLLFSRGRTIFFDVD